MTTTFVDAPEQRPAHRLLIKVRRVATVLIYSRPILLLILTVWLAGYMAYYHTPSFLTGPNLRAVLLDCAQNGIMVVGMMILMVAGAFDLSIGSTLALSGVVSAVLIADHQVPVPLGVAGGLLSGAVCGLFNGLMVTKIRINPLIATLATMGIFRGITQLISGTGVSSIGSGFAKLGQTVMFGLQSPVWVMLAVVVIGAFAVGQTRFFRQYYFIGGNLKAARLSGIRTDRLVLLAFVIMGVLAALAGVLGAARLNSAVVSAGIGVELQVITAAVLGGASLKGGEGKVIGGVLGVIFIALLTNALIILQVDVFWQNIVVGVVLLLAVSLDRWKQVVT
jgi:ribose transport system permease protein